MPSSENRIHHPRSEVGLAELVEVLYHLQPGDAQTRSVIIETLDLAEAVAPKSTIAENKHLQKIAELNDLLAEWLATESKPLEEPSESLGSDRAELEILTPSEETSFLVEALVNAPLSDVDELGPAQPAHVKPPNRLPLWRTEWFRGIAGPMLATSHPSRDIDWQFLERRLATGLPLKRLPWRHRPSLKRGVQVLLDYSESMQPFWRDESDLLAQLRKLVGKPGVRVWRFVVDTWRPAESRWKWVSSASRAFASDTPVLVVSDFGIGRGAMDPELWLEGLRCPELAPCAMTALIPAPESSWPPWLKRVVPRAFVWDRDTSLQTMRRKLPRIR